ncbi:MarC family protein [Sphingomicrobium astaxanthinifaciens]|uniref:MarC family protein n=1 Tax=Sphingomicrobium astaxanthinifaciens TaxID=1227949 RepID=UPI001FCB5F2B|nr:MarC family protein [Sphingomicrobium astaxanthinifaciens]MCJ7421302.1 MarC family protein [Sphingomicrobium astaxanthinifaciens]
MIELFVSAFVTFLVIVDPPGNAPIFAGLTRDASAPHRRRMAIRAAIVAWFILLFFAYLGEPLLGALGISLAAFRIAGGIMLFMIALDMVFEKRTERRENRASEIEGTPEAEDVSVFPMAIPMIAGPGTIAAIMLYMAEASSMAERLTITAAMSVVILLTLGALLAAGPLMKLMGAKLEAMITRLLGVILAALASQFVIDGIAAALISELRTI